MFSHVSILNYFYTKIWCFLISVFYNMYKAQGVFNISD